MDIFIGIIIGFAICGIITFLWYHGTLKPRFDALKALAEKKIREKL